MNPFETYIRPNSSRIFHYFPLRSVNINLEKLCSSVMAGCHCCGNNNNNTTVSQKHCKCGLLRKNNSNTGMLI